MDLDLLKSELLNKDLLKEIIYFEELDSTNNYAKRNSPATDTLIITPNQTNGTGRFKRQWKTEPFKDLTFTLVKDINTGIDEMHTVNFYSSYIVLISLQEYLSDRNVYKVTLKWPNDVLVNFKKIAGILMDVKNLNCDIKKFSIGIGINVNNKEIIQDLTLKATSLINETKIEVSIENILIRLIKNFYENLSLINERNKLMEKWRANTEIINRRINFRRVENDTAQAVTIINIDTDGALVVRTDDEKIEKFYSGEISIS